MVQCAHSGGGWVGKYAHRLLDLGKILDRLPHQLFLALDLLLLARGLADGIQEILELFGRVPEQLDKASRLVCLDKDQRCPDVGKPETNLRASL